MLLGDLGFWAEAFKRAVESEVALWRSGAKREAFVSIELEK